MEDFKEYLNQSVVEARKMKRGQYNIRKNKDAVRAMKLKDEE